MKLSKSAIISTVAFMAVSLVGFSFAKTTTDKIAIRPDVSAKEIKSFTLENWDETEWEVFTDKDGEVPSTYYTDAEGKDIPDAKKWKKDLTNSQVMRQVKLVDGAPRDIRNLDTEKGKTAKVLGVKFHFTYPGYNEVTMRPPRTKKYEVIRSKPFLNENDFKKGQDGKFAQPSNRSYSVYGLEMPGVSQEVSLWVNGRGNDYELEGWFQDWKGDTHILKFGSLNFIGWRPLKIAIPSNVPQGVDSYPRNKTLVLTQFRLRSHPKTSGESVILFFDEIKVLTNTHDVHFDGADLNFDSEDCESKNKKDKLLKVSNRDCGGAEKQPENKQ